MEVTRGYMRGTGRELCGCMKGGGGGYTGRTQHDSDVVHILQPGLESTHFNTRLGSLLSIFSHYSFEVDK
jgi:hypothetical protein